MFKKKRCFCEEIFIKNFSEGTNNILSSLRFVKWFRQLRRIVFVHCTIFVLFSRSFTFVYRSKMILDKLQKLHIGLSSVEMVQFLTNNFWYAIILKIPYPVIKPNHFTTLLNLAKLTPITTNWFIEKWKKNDISIQKTHATKIIFF